MTRFEAVILDLILIISLRVVESLYFWMPMTRSGLREHLYIMTILGIVIFAITSYINKIANWKLGHFVSIIGFLVSLVLFIHIAFTFGL